MELTDAQKTTIAEWVNQGEGLSGIQKRLAEELDLSMTYMDVRFLIIDLGLTLKEEESPAVKAQPKEDADNPEPEAEAHRPADEPMPAGGGGVHVEVDRIVKPGAVVSGSVSFSDGQQATWMLDQLGRLALDAGDPGYRPSEADVADFQEALKNALQKQGF